MNIEQLKKIEENLSFGRKIAIVTVINTEGSSPASKGQEMLVEESGKTYGTIGGGNSEFIIINKALEMMKNGEKVELLDYNMSDAGMICGGKMSVTIKILGNEERLIIFGGGHISKSLAKFAQGIGMSVTIVEDRKDLIENFENVEYIACEPEEYAEKINIGTNAYIVICTRGHKYDYEALRFVIEKETKYTGMIGSRKKVDTTLDSLRKNGISEDRIKSIFSPIGLDIASEKPEEIAISILAEILLVKNGGSLNQMRDLKE